MKRSRGSEPSELPSKREKAVPTAAKRSQSEAVPTRRMRTKGPGPIPDGDDLFVGRCERIDEGDIMQTELEDRGANKEIHTRSSPLNSKCTAKRPERA